MTRSLARAATLVGYQSAQRYQARAQFVFDGIHLAGKHVLDVGCGPGAWAIWTALQGATAIGLEPEADGSTRDTLSALRRNIEQLGLTSNVEASGRRLEELPPELTFDVVILYDVVNHLDEDSVQTLHRGGVAAEKYLTVFRGIRARMRDSGWLIISDCARRNFWNDLALTPPLARTIEWDKHQNPGVWAGVLERAGFRVHDLRWSPLQPFPRLTANRLAQYLTTSHFVLRVRT